MAIPLSGFLNESLREFIGGYRPGLRTVSEDWRYLTAAQLIHLTEFSIRPILAPHSEEEIHAAGEEDRRRGSAHGG